MMAFLQTHDKSTDHIDPVYISHFTSVCSFNAMGVCDDNVLLDAYSTMVFLWSHDKLVGHIVPVS